MQINEPSVIEILVNGKSHGMTNAENSAEGSRAETQVCILAQELEAVFFRLNGVFFRISFSVDDNFSRI